MRRILGPARHAEVDLRDGAMPVAVKERAELSLQYRRKQPPEIGGREPLGGQVGERGARRLIRTGAPGELPEREVHLGGGVERKPAQHRAKLVLRRGSSEDAAGDSEGEVAAGGERDEFREEPRRHRKEETLE